jgi:uncharacterized protein YyaL (SSP411 family)
VPTNHPPARAGVNRLAREKSPYLLQHQHNPVDWHAWNDEAFAHARAQNKPIFLSIGYSTCHWCHVMERESFESEPLAAYLNEHFVSIKVDREERPDVDKIYMTFVQSTSGGGGWPLNCFLTPDLKPFFGGTYFPPDNRHGRPGFLELLKHIVRLWETRNADILNSAAQLHEKLVEITAKAGPADSSLTPAVLDNAAALFKQNYDPLNGGFGNAPKFPQPSQPLFLLSHGVQSGDAEAVRMVLHTCERMAAGGIYDQLGGGFARYSVDALWLVPHFEKMLYDNAQLVNLYLDAFLVSGEARHADTARDIIRYVLRDMTHPEGGFYSAEDADSEGKEGKFYCWTRAELSKLLTPEEFNVAARYFGVSERGNFVDHSDPDPLPGQNVLSIAEPKLAPADAPLLESAKTKMFAARAQRVRPHLDDKVLASWNGLMLGALARAHAVLGAQSEGYSPKSGSPRPHGNPVGQAGLGETALAVGSPRPLRGGEGQGEGSAYLAAAEKNLAFLQDKLWDAKTATLYHRWRDGERDTVQLLDAYAFLLSGVIDLYEATLAPAHLDFAVALADAMLARFYDRDAGGFWQSAPDAPDLILRVKEDYDGAEPSGNSVAALALLKLAAITDRKDYREAADRTLRLFAERLQHLPQAVPFMLLAYDFSREEPKRVVIAGDPAAADTRALLHAAHSIYQPRKVVLGTVGAVEPFAKTLPVKDGATVYLCTGTACQPPTKDAEEVQNMLRR